MFRAALIVGATSIVALLCELVSHSGVGAATGEWLSWIKIAVGLIGLAALAVGAPLAIRELGARRVMAADALRARREVEQLFRMTDMLQSASGHDDANAVLRATASGLLAGCGGALYVFNNSRDRLDLSTTWGWPDDAPLPEAVPPAHCWALKRGKSHVNRIGTAALRCEHLADHVEVLELPMMARGEVYGLLCLQADGEQAQEKLEAAAPLASAIADTMSLTLANIALREKLRTQALRDPLTGLYNRRYMEDVLERSACLAERNNGELSVLMIDLDHFKHLNDAHGHAVGDAVLRQVSAVIVGAIRPCDVACRYGGEELLIVLPDCSLDDAMAMAETLRSRIENLSDNHGRNVTASFGVAAMPTSSATVADLVSDADAALYGAKRGGRNRVLSAPRRRGSGLDPAPAAASGVIRIG
ncbi:GGDEF domain-containing protein [Sphingomonas abietis]|uniref:diguanylate cyclase n=1 Tax=Sphingomonas abietis TaxID=3012344 RepID=A0ABY7NN13_9SPHN|nr:GGDEF domain-containing protein [Sphingomonas abietis]WBO22915.1 GGDEF domain-containing protein [Sphingomonas abietis]